MRMEFSHSGPALLDDTSEEWLSYGALAMRVQEMAALLKPEERSLVLCCPPRSIEGAIAYLAASHAGHAILLADPQAPNLATLIEAYRPRWILAPQATMPIGYKMRPLPFQTIKAFERDGAEGATLHPDLFLVLLTSGSTGSAKSVRLSARNIEHNTKAIVQSLNLTKEAVAVGHLPLAYSFGLSILHMQLACGGRCVLSEQSMMGAAFWNLVRQGTATHFPGVPYHFEMLARLGLERLRVPSLTSFLQAGGKMRGALTQKLLEEAQGRNGELFIMYGQTEAAPRMACLPLHLYPEKIGSSGPALQEGRFEIEEGEIIYTGPNVMMGYAEGLADLARGDVAGGRLTTGDTGLLDENGFLTITGRKKRFAKLFGQRIALDDLESLAAPLAFTVALETSEKIVLLTNETDEALLRDIKSLIVTQTKFPAPWIEVRSVQKIPLQTTGKIDYKKMQSMVD